MLNGTRSSNEEIGQLLTCAPRDPDPTPSPTYPEATQAAEQQGTGQQGTGGTVAPTPISDQQILAVGVGVGAGVTALASTGGAAAMVYRAKHANVKKDDIVQVELPMPAPVQTQPVQTQVEQSPI